MPSAYVITRAEKIYGDEELAAANGGGTLRARGSSRLDEDRRKTARD
jgi:hypothetical protein